MEQQPNQQTPPTGGVPGPTGRRLHIAHRRSPSELTPLMSMFANPGSKLSPYALPLHHHIGTSDIGFLSSRAWLLACFHPSPDRCRT